MNWRLSILGDSRSRAAAALITVLALASFLVAGGVPALARGHSGTRTAALVKTTPARILVAPNGRTLYVFASDRKNKSACYGTCAKFWPPVVVKKGASAPSKIGSLPGTFGVAMRKDGTEQLTYDGAPLYTFAEDKKKGDMNGQGLFAAGNFWWAVVAGGK